MCELMLDPLDLPSITRAHASSIVQPMRSIVYLWYYLRVHLGLVILIYTNRQLKPLSGYPRRSVSNVGPTAPSAGFQRWASHEVIAVAWAFCHRVSDVRTCYSKRQDTREQSTHPNRSESQRISNGQTIRSNYDAHR